MRLRTALITAIAAGMTSVVLATAAEAAPDVPLTIVSPANGSTIQYGTPMQLVIDAPTARQPVLDVGCVKAGTSSYSISGYIDLVAGRNTIDWEDLVLVDVGSVCTITIAAYSGASPAQAQSTFTMAGPAVQLSEFTFAQTNFYPLVKDDYRDEAAFTVTVNRPTDFSLSIADAKGSVVYNVTDRLPSGGEFDGTWDGRTRSGKPVLPGKYRATMTATADGVTVSKSATVSVLTKMKTRRLTQSTYGSSGDQTRRGKCNYDYDFDEGTTALNCQGGEYADSTYSFKIPANAKNIKWSVDTSHTPDDFSSRGAITKSGRRASSTSYDVRVAVSGYRAVIVNRVSLSYKARVKV